MLKCHLISPIYKGKCPNTQGTRGGPVGHDRMLDVKRIKYSQKSIFCFFKIKITLHISASYAKILGETNFQPREIPRIGSKAKDRDKKRKDRKLVITMASYALQRHLGWRTQSRLGRKCEIHDCFQYMAKLSSFNSQAKLD